MGSSSDPICIREPER
uniref:Uncharacterized protein n=1 Tax=Arundo donax TaxID=35708 RepID=A0A0A8YM50_ARUDO